MKSKFKLLLITLSFILIFPVINVSAASTNDDYYLSSKKLRLQEGNTCNLYLMGKNDTYEDECYWRTYYECSWKSSDESVATVSGGMVTVVGKGTATIIATYNNKEYSCSLTAYASSYHITRSDITTKTFTQEELRMTHNDKVYDYYYRVYKITDGEAKLQKYGTFYINIDSETGNITLEARKSGTYRIDFYAEVKQEDSYETQSFKTSCNVIVTPHGLEEKEIGCSINSTRKLTFGDLSQITFQVDNTSIATVNEEGIITPLSVGSTTITMTGYNAQYEQEEYYCDIEITNPVVTFDKDYVLLGDYFSPNISGNSWSEDIIYKSSNPEIIGADYEFTAKKTGRATVAVTVDGQKFVFKVEVIDPKLAKNSFLLTKSQTANLKLTGLNAALKAEPVTYTVDNKKIATVSKDGKITAKACGSTVITVKVGDFSFGAVVSVGNKSSIQAIKKAYEAIGATYSQEKRMQKGYYDCSSLVWRSFSPYGVNFGASSYAPTAANLAKYLSDHNKVVSDKMVDPMTLQPGDLLFYSYSNNGRFKNIDHVAIFTGISSDISVDYYTGELYYYGEIVHASQGTIKTAYVSEYSGPIVMIGRP